MSDAPAYGLSWRVVTMNDGAKLGRWVFFCQRCEREQAYAPKGQPGGVDEREATKLGWRVYMGAWVCPFCEVPKGLDWA